MGKGVGEEKPQLLAGCMSESGKTLGVQAQGFPQCLAWAFKPPFTMRKEAREGSGDR